MISPFSPCGPHPFGTALRFERLNHGTDLLPVAATRQASIKGAV